MKKDHKETKFDVLKAENKQLKEALTKALDGISTLTERVGKMERSAIEDRQQEREQEEEKNVLRPYRNTKYPYRGAWLIEWSQGGKLPTKLSGGYTEYEIALRAIRDYEEDKLKAELKVA